MDAVDLRPSDPPVVHVLDDGREAAEPRDARISRLGGKREHPILVELFSGPRISCLGGEREHPILVELFSGPRRKRPISVDDEVQLVEEVAEPGIGIARRGGDRSHPISVEGYAASLRRRGSPEVVVLEGSEGFRLNPADPRGKRPIGASRRRWRRKNSVGEGEASAVDVGQSSSHSAAAAAEAEAEAEAYCGICMEEKLHCECVSTMGCPHVYCKSCVSQYVAAKVEENEVSIKCPDPGCKVGFLEPEMCRPILPPEVFDRWGSRLSEAVILETMKFYCPYKDCSALLIDERGVNGEVITDSECPHCSRMFCARCKVPWHAEVTCEEYQRLGADEREKEDLMLRKMAISHCWQRCPKCKFYVERTEGCNFIMCRCRYTFCYRCAGPMGASHYCPRCKR